MAYSGAPGKRLTIVAGGLQEPAQNDTDDALQNRADALKRLARSESTRAAYQSDFAHFKAWCTEQGRLFLPAAPATVELYLAAHADKLKVSTLERRLVSISRQHQAEGYDTPTGDRKVRETLKGIRREAALEGRAAPRQKAPLVTKKLRSVIDVLDLETLMGKRDKALLLLGFAGALRASEIGQITVADLKDTGSGYLLTIRRSKTDQEGQGQQIAIPLGTNEDLCPVRAVKAWLKAAHIKKGPVIRAIDRHGNVAETGLRRWAVGRIIKAAATRAGLDGEAFAGHSLRAGLATSAALNGAPYAKIKQQTRHKSDKVLGRYVRDAELFRDNAANTAGL